MLMLPAPSPPKRGMAIKRYCDQRLKIARMTETLYVSPFGVVFKELEYESEIEAIPDEHDLLIQDINRDVLQKQINIRLFEAVLAFNRGEPLDAIFLKGLVPHAV